MSRIGRQPVVIPEGVQVTVEGDKVLCKGKEGELERRLPPGIVAELKGGELLLRASVEGKRGKAKQTTAAFWGLARALCQNMVTGVDTGFNRVLEIQGVGYRAEVSASELILHLGFSHPVRLSLPEGISAKVEQNRLTLHSRDKERLGDFAAAVRRHRPVEPYKGKGIRYAGEKVRRKAGKAGKVGAK